MREVNWDKSPNGRRNVKEKTKMIKKLLVPILKICKSKFIKIEDPRFANREAEQIGTKLVNFTEQKEDFSKSAFRAGQKEQERMARERHEQIMAGRDKKYVSEQTVPNEGEILGPSDSALKEEEK